MFKDDAINKMTFNLSVPSYSAALTSGGVLYTLAEESKNLLQIVLPTEAPKKVGWLVDYSLDFTGMFYTKLFCFSKFWTFQTFQNQYQACLYLFELILHGDSKYRN